MLAFKDRKQNDWQYEKVNNFTCTQSDIQSGSLKGRKVRTDRQIFSDIQESTKCPCFIETYNSEIGNIRSKKL